MTWDDLGRGARELAETVAEDGYRPDMILGIARGGLLVGGAMGYALGIKNTFTMNVEFYTGVDERLDIPMILPPVPDLVDFADFKVLIADDVADTGATLDRPLRVRLAAHRPVDHLPVERGRPRSAGHSLRASRTWPNGRLDSFLP